MARYCDGRSASVSEAAIEAQTDGLTVHVPTWPALWPYGSLRRTDDGGRETVLRLEPDTGERLTLTADEDMALGAVAPQLYTTRALNPERPRLVLALMASAFAAAAAFLIGVPLEAGAIAHFVPARYKEHLGEMAWSQVSALTSQCEGTMSSRGLNALDEIYQKLRAETPNIPEGEVYLVDASFPNAFSMPDGSIVVTDELIALAESPDEIAGVIAHELGHVSSGHIMKNIVRQMGLGIFVDIVFGGAGAGQAIAAINVLALRYSREDEAEADHVAIGLMDRAGYNPGAVAALFRRLAGAQSAQHGWRIPEFLSSHPDTLQRAAEAARHARADRAPALSADDWQALKQACTGAEEPAADDDAHGDPPEDFPAPTPGAP